MGSKVCIVCGKEKDGCCVPDDVVLSAIRGAKRRLGFATGNTLVVCGEDIETAVAKRARFEKYLMWYGLLAAAIFLILVFSSRSLYAVLVGLAAAACVLLLSLTTYYPRIPPGCLRELDEQKKAAERAALEAKAAGSAEPGPETS
jgi:fucose permease